MDPMILTGGVNVTGRVELFRPELRSEGESVTDCSARTYDWGGLRWRDGRRWKRRGWDGKRVEGQMMKKMMGWALCFIFSFLIALF
ncbi:hypothetical protein HanRHA438_Chr12g0572731 [Helianthus annuus]|nr:hypothetical protein HanRHA438_Chr12g0572731 [Helianthus annuus]